jgi:MYXO-CTERM domain-containing protein
MTGLLFLLTQVSPAWADVAPIDRCYEVGEHCVNGGPLGDQPGVCEPDECARGAPDGGEVAYECLTCVPEVDGATDDGCDCRVMTTGPSERALAGAMLLVGLGALGWARRRRGT